MPGTNARSGWWCAGVMLLMACGGAGTGNQGGSGSSSSGGGSTSSSSSSGGSSSSGSGSSSSSSSSSSGSSSGGSAWGLPAERSTLWKPGVTYNGGIPHRTTIYTTLSPRGGGLDDTARIQAALDACPADQVVQLTAGTFVIAPQANGGLFLTRSNITLRGTLDAAGEPATVLTCPQDGACGAILSVGTLWYHPGASIDVTADVAKESRTVVVASNPGFQVGELVIVDETTDDTLSWWSRRCSPACVGTGEQCDYPDCRTWFIRSDRPVGQVNEIAAVSGNTLTFTAPFHMRYRTSHRAQVTRIPQHSGFSPTTRSGIEDLKVSGGAGGDGGGNVHLYAASYCWLRNVEADRSGGTSINFDGTFRCELRDSYVHSTIDANPGGAGYGIGFNFHAADNLVENSISWNFNKVMVMRASGGGNVIGYSYFEDGWGESYPCIVESGMNASHYTTSHMELFEGNRSFSFTAESTWGNSVYITVFRNHLTARRGAFAPLDAYHYDYVDGGGNPASLFYEDLQGRRAVGISARHYWQTLVGNVLGTSGQTLVTNPRTQGMDRQVRFVYDDDGQNDTQNVPMWSVGWGEGPQDARTVSTLLRHGNYDYVTRATAWNAGASQDLPPSLYLPGKPAFMGSNPWPWVDPLTGQTYVLPAKARFDRIHGAH